MEQQYYVIEVRRARENQMRCIRDQARADNLNVNR